MTKSWLGLQFAEENRSKLSWILQLRFFALGGLATGGVLAPSFGFLPTVYFDIFAVTWILLLSWNLYSWFFVLRSSQSVAPVDLFSQLVVDLSAMTMVLSLTGGIYNPFSVFLLIYAVMAAMTLERLGILVFLILFLASLGYLQWQPDVAHLELRGEITRSLFFVSLSAVGLLFSYLMLSYRHRLKGIQLHLQVLKEKEDRLDRLKLAGAMAAGFSHEFSSPLYSLRLNLERIHRHQVTDDSTEALGSLDDCERILKNLTENGLKSRQLQIERVSISEVLHQWVFLYQKQHPDRWIEVSTEGVLATDFLEVPLAPLQQSFFDLIDNAFEATPLDRSPRVVVIRLSKENALGESMICLAVENRGEPIPEIVMAKWGEPFVTSKTDGTGLGLFNALTLVKAMGGDLQVVYPASGQTEIRMLIPTLPEKANDGSRRVME